MKTGIGLSVSNEVLEQLDMRRGLVARSTYIEDILRKEFGLKRYGKHGV